MFSAKSYAKLLIVCIVVPFCNCGYILKQGTYLLKYNARAENINQILKKKSTPDDLKRFLLLVNDIRGFAIDSIELSKNSNYSTYVKIDKPYLVDVVSASENLSFRQHKWCWPIVGCVPYKGFYERKDAEKEAAKLKKKGYDINIDEVDAFSTLGFFTDPVYSFMKEYTVYGLASLIIHEQTHATFYKKSQAQFNEELATFVGDEGGLLYVRSRYGENSEEYRNAILAREDYESYFKLLRGLYNELKMVYDDGKKSEKEKLADKDRIIASFKDMVSQKYNEYFKTNNYRGISKRKINNAYIAVRMTYTLDLSEFYRLYENEKRNLKSTVGFFKSLKHQKGNPADLLRKKIESK